MSLRFHPSRESLAFESPSTVVLERVPDIIVQSLLLITSHCGILPSIIEHTPPGELLRCPATSLAIGIEASAIHALAEVRLGQAHFRCVEAVYIR